jgi:glycosyltransferase involved in cell wall biosynthesis
MSYHIIHTISSYNTFGPEKTTINESVILQKQDYKVTIVAICPKGMFPFLEKAKKAGVSCCHLVSNLKFDIFMVFKLQKLLSELKCDLVHSHGYKSDTISLIACHLAGVPIVTTIHGWTSKNLKVRIYEKIQAFCWRFFNRVICVSESYKQKALQNGVPEGKITVIHNGIMVDNRIIEGIENKRISFLNRYGIPSNHFIVGIIGRLSIEKGHRYFIEAAYQVLKQESNVSFVIVGDGPEEDRIRKQIEQLGVNRNIHMIGYSKEMKEVYAALDAVVIASLREGLPNVLLEAMLYEKPVIAAKVGGIPEVIRDNEEGLLVPPASSSTIANTLLTLIRHPDQRKRISYAARKRVVEHFSFERRMTQIENLYKEVIQEHRNSQRNRYSLNLIEEVIQK